MNWHYWIRMTHVTLPLSKSRIECFSCRQGNTTKFITKTDWYCLVSKTWYSCDVEMGRITTVVLQLGELG